MNRALRYLLALAGFLAAARQSMAVPTQISSFDTPGCDVLSVPTLVDELGNPPAFPTNELITSQTLGITPLTACPSMPPNGAPNYLVSMTNLTGTTWSNVWYVADFETKINNSDGIVNAGLEAFKIDNDPTGVQLNNPLVFESGPVDNMWQPGETWRFIVDGYSNAFSLQPSLFNQIGVPSGSPNGSSGNIIATPLVPEPSGVAVLIIAGFALLAQRRR